MSMKPKLSIIIPAYNEERRIAKTLRELSTFFGRKNTSYEIIVIMDGCTDGTHGIVEAAMKKDKNIRYKSYHDKQGKGGALLNGFRHARGEYVAYVDADGSTSPSELYRLYKSIGNFDGVIGSRWLKESDVAVKQPFLRRIASRGFNRLTHVILGLPFKDTQCPAKIFRQEVVKSVAKELTVTNFAFDACMLCMIKKRGYKINEVAIAWKDKPLSSLRMSRVIPRMFYTIIKMRIRGK
jgi:glycosyltransferase involved in cell wall biosynthesis